MKKLQNNLKLLFGLFISGVFLFFAFRKIDFVEMKQSFAEANYLIFIPSLVIIFLSHWLRSVRWQYLLKPIKKISVKHLFSALIIGYMGNAVLPAHLGEFFRAYIIGRKEHISVSSTLATIVIERILDLLSLLLIMAFAIIIYPFPAWVKKSGYILFILTMAIPIFLILLKKYTAQTVGLINQFLKFLPLKFSQRIIEIIHSFVGGVQELESKKDYLIIMIQSIFIWACYWFVLHINFYTFNFIDTYQLTVTSSIVLLVITTISIVVPSSPGYVGTYHLLCQLSLELFGVPRSIGLTYAIVLHALNFVPVIIVGIIFTWREGLSLINLSQKKLD